MPIYTIGRSHLLELFHSELQSGLVRMVEGPMSRRAYEQLANLETELRETGTDLGITCAMLAWAAQHPHLQHWTGALGPRRRHPRQQFNWDAFT